MGRRAQRRSEGGDTHVRQQPVRGQDNPRNRRRDRARQGDGRAVSRARRENCDLRAAQERLRRNSRGIDEILWRPRRELWRRHSRRGGGRRDGRGDFSRSAAHRPRQQRRGKFHLAHRGPVAARVRRDRQHRDARHVLCDTGCRQALDRGQAQGQRDLDRSHLGAQRRPVRRALGDEQGGDPGDDHVARAGMGPLRHPPERDRAGRNPDRGHEQAPFARRRAWRRDRRQKSVGTGRPDGGIAEPRRVPDVRRLRMADRRNDRDGRRCRRSRPAAISTNCAVGATRSGKRRARRSRLRARAKRPSAAEGNGRGS